MGQQELSPEELAIVDNLVAADKEKQDKFSRWDDTTQRKIMSILLCDRFFLIQAIDLIKPDYFTNECHTVICRILFKSFKKYKGLPEKFLMRQELAEALGDKDKPIVNYYMAELEAAYDYYTPGIHTRDALLDKIANFAKEQAVKYAFYQSIQEMKGGDDEKWSKIYTFMQDAMKIERNFDPGLEFFMNPEEMFRLLKEQQSTGESFTTAFKEIDDSITGGSPLRGELYGCIALPGRGKCSPKNTPILMFDCTIKMVQDVEVGDLLMGPDSKPRKVLNTHIVYDQVYEIKPVKGDSYFVNGEHILCLKDSQSGDIRNISVNDWLKQDASFKKRMKGWRAKVEFLESEVRINPYILGFWLGSPSNEVSFSNIVIEAISGDLKSDPNDIRADLLSYNLIDNKHIPKEYKINSRELRLKLLAGILDACGEIEDFNYVICLKNGVLSQDILLLARSLGFTAYMEEECQNYKISIFGDCFSIPVKLKNIDPIKQTSDPLMLNIDVIDTGKKDFLYGFEVNKNHLFLLGDFTVYHNSLSLTKSAVENCKLGHNVLYLSLEMNQVSVAERFTAQFCKTNVNHLIDNENYILDMINDFKKEQKDNKNLLIIKKFPGGEIDVNTIRAFFSQLELLNWKPDLFILDYINELKRKPKLSTHESIFEYLSELRGFGGSQNHVTYTCVQPNRSATNLTQLDEFITESSIGSSFDAFRPFDGFWSINQTTNEKRAGIGRIFVMKMRRGKSQMDFKIGFDYEKGTLDIEQISQKKYAEKLGEVQVEASEATAVKPNKFNQHKSVIEPDEEEVDEASTD